MPAPQKIHDLVAQFERNRDDYQIDQLVYQLYNLTDEEIGIVEGE